MEIKKLFLVDKERKDILIVIFKFKKKVDVKSSNNIYCPLIQSCGVYSTEDFFHQIRIPIPLCTCYCTRVRPTSKFCQSYHHPLSIQLFPKHNTTFLNIYILNQAICILNQWNVYMTSQNSNTRPVLYIH